MSHLSVCVTDQYQHHTHYQQLYLFALSPSLSDTQLSTTPPPPHHSFYLLLPYVLMTFLSLFSPHFGFRFCLSSLPLHAHSLFSVSFFVFPTVTCTTHLVFTKEGITCNLNLSFSRGAFKFPINASFKTASRPKTYPQNRRQFKCPAVHMRSAGFPFMLCYNLHPW